MSERDFRPAALAVVRIILRACGWQPIIDTLNDVVIISDTIRNKSGPVPSRKQIEKIVQWAQGSLSTFFEAEYSGDYDNDVASAILAVAELLNRQAFNDLILRAVVDSSALEGELLANGGRKIRDHLLSENAITAFDILLRSTCRHLAEVTLSAPEFGPLALQRLLRGQNQLELISRQIFDTVNSLANSLYKEVDFAAFTSRYLDRVAEQLDFLDLPGIDLERHRQRYNLTMAYIPIGVRGQEARQFEFTALDSLARLGGFILVVGDPGTGKSTLLKWAAVEAARSFAHRKVQRQMVPFLIKLRSLPNSLPDLDDIGSPLTEGLVVPRPPHWAHDLITAGRAILLFDGLDEVPENRRESIIRWIRQIHKDYGRRGTQVIVTSRPAAILGYRYLLGAAVTATLLPMPHSKIERFVKLWHRSIYAAPDIQGSADWKAESDRLLARLEVDTQLLQLASNPLLCAVICSLYHAHGQHLPSERSELYEALLAMLLARRDSERPGIEVLLSLTDTHRLVEDIALAFLRLERNEVPQQDVLDILKTSLHSFRNHEVRDMRPVRVLEHFLARTGVLRELPPHGTIDFWHKSFQEFLAARVLVDQGQDRELVQHCGESSWREVIVWASSLMRQKRASLFINDLLDAVEAAPKKSDHNYLTGVAFSCAHYTIQLDDTVQERLNAHTDTLIPPVTSTQLAVIVDLGAAAVPLLVDALRMPIDFLNREQVIEHLIGALTNIGGEAVNNALAMMPAQFKREWALQLGRGWSSTGSEDYARRVLGSVPYDEQGTPVLVEIISLRQLRSIEHLPAVYRPAVSISSNDFDRDDLGPGSSRPIARVSLDGDVAWTNITTFLRTYTMVNELSVTLAEDLAPDYSAEVIPNLRHLHIFAQSTITIDLDALAIFPDLQILEISGSIALKGLNSFIGNIHLKEVHVEAWGGVHEVMWHGNIERLAVYPWPHSSLKELRELKHLQSLDVSESEALESLEGARELPEIAELDVSFCERLKDVEDAVFNPTLSSLVIEGCDEVSSADLQDMYFDVDSGEDDLGKLSGESPVPGLIGDRWLNADIYAMSEEELELRGWNDWSFWEEIRGDADEWATPDPGNELEESLKNKGLVLYQSFDAWWDSRRDDSQASSSQEDDENDVLNGWAPQYLCLQRQLSVRANALIRRLTIDATYDL